MKEFDYTKIYYKVTNKDECHNGYQYKDGLNILNEEFNDDPNASCVPGGFYFTDYKNLPQFFEYGTWIREVTIPPDARVVLDPEGDKWRCDKIILGKKYHIVNDFKEWFDPNRFNWKYSFRLARYCPEQFDLWFDKEKYNWEFPEYLAQYCADKFDKWFDIEKFTKHPYYIQYLAHYCTAHFDKWFNADTFDWDYSNCLAQYCVDYFDKWFDPNKFNWDYSCYLAEFCSKHFLKWFDPNKFDWYYSKYLEEFCSEYKHIWEKYIPEIPEQE
jgi:hypothetical protein